MPCTTRLIFLMFGLPPMRTEVIRSRVAATDCGVRALGALLRLLRCRRPVRSAAPSVEGGDAGARELLAELLEPLVRVVRRPGPEAARGR